MSAQFRIHKFDDGWKPWELDYPDGFDDTAVGSMHDTFAEAVAAFVKASDVAVGCKAPVMSKTSKPGDRWSQVYTAAADRPPDYCPGCGYYRRVNGEHRGDCTAPEAL